MYPFKTRIKNRTDTVSLSMKLTCIFLLLFAISACESDGISSAVSKEPTESILFIGNSYTYENGGINTHLHYLLAGTKNHHIPFIGRAAKGKYHLYTHWHDSETKRLFKSKKWDKIVLQEYSSGPLKETKQFQEYAAKWSREIRKVNSKAEIYLYATWNYKNSPGMEDSLYSEYKKVSNKIHAKVVPVGMLWKRLQSKIDLYDADGAHPNRKGTFVTACLFYEHLFHLDVTKTEHTDPYLSKREQQTLKRWAHEFNHPPLN